MERLTQHSKKTGSPVPSEVLGDICLRISGCDNYDFCEGCPINELLTRLCAYEDTGLTPEQFGYKKFMRESAKYDVQLNMTKLESFINADLAYDQIGRIGSHIAKEMQKLSANILFNELPLSGNPRIRVNRAISYLAEKEAFDLKDGKLSIDDSKVPELQTEARNLKTMLIRRIKNACE